MLTISDGNPSRAPSRGMGNQSGCPPPSTQLLAHGLHLERLAIHHRAQAQHPNDGSPDCLLVMNAISSIEASSWFKPACGDLASGNRKRAPRLRLLSVSDRDALAKQPSLFTALLYPGPCVGFIERFHHRHPRAFSASTACVASGPLSYRNRCGLWPGLARHARSRCGASVAVRDSRQILRLGVALSVLLQFMGVRADRHQLAEAADGLASIVTETRVA